MTTRQLLFSGWGWHASALAFCVVIVAAYVAFARRNEGAGVLRPVSSPRPAYLAVALLMFLVAEVSPVNTLAEGYLFSAHMVQHLLLLLVVPPLLLLSLPETGAEQHAALESGPGPTSSPGENHVPAMGTRIPGTRFAARSAMVFRALALLTHPIPGWLAGVGAMWLWHVPALCDAAASSHAVRGLQTASLLGLGTVFWLPIFGPQLQRRMSPLAGVAYLFGACIACSLLGIFLTFTPITVCSAYVHSADRLGILPLIRNVWGMTPALDQQIGGLLMWIPGCFVYLSGIMVLLARWYATGENRVPERRIEAPLAQ